MVGQFIRHATLTRDVRRFGAARYHAFVASSLQHEEERAGDLTPQRCVSSYEPSASRAAMRCWSRTTRARITASPSTWDYAFYDRDVFLYPHRIASFFSTVSRGARSRVALAAV